ncbi:hypothetical protein GcM1_214030 [Golovinomyces cichoracearum]|uniref:Golgi to ER traffic protein 2 n=1 Tax=Golovinomyces cichoracearum TaxID=62708 RepID=A0A420IU41_9PEZI|nr:hypothetical protein GcM1_214030 [Golovinomyces cichoracearum]
MSQIPETPSEQARIRKERREAKIRAGGAARINKITGLGGGLKKAEDSNPTKHSILHPDPEEDDISKYNNVPANFQNRREENSSSISSFLNSEDALRSLMPEFNAMNTSLPNDYNHFLASSNGMSPMDGTALPENPIMKVLQQAMGSVPTEGPRGLPTMPDLSSQESATNINPHTRLWRIIHALCAIAISTYIALTTKFTGTRFERENSTFEHSNVYGEQTLNLSSFYFFYLFLTVEVVLLSSRYYFDRENTVSGGIMDMLTRFLQEPIRGYFLLAMRYLAILTTVGRDAMVCVFVLGSFSWWKSKSVV